MLKKTFITLIKNSNRKFACFVALTFFFINTSKAQTYISGGIYHDTTWTLAGSPYIITGNVVVFQQIKVTIQPGVKVKFNSNALIEVEGSLYANGTLNDSIIFTSNSASPHAGIFRGIASSATSDTLSFRYCRFSFADTGFFAGPGFLPPVSHCLFVSNLSGFIGNEGGLAIDTCVFKYDSTGLYLQGAYNSVKGCLLKDNKIAIGAAGPSINYSQIINCTIINNRWGIYGSQSTFIYNCTIDSNANYGLNYATQDTIFDCRIRYNGTGVSGGFLWMEHNNISHNNVGIYSGGDCDIELDSISDNGTGVIETGNDFIIACNSICGNTSYNVEMDMPGNINIKDNFWCLHDSAHIQATIYDAYQNINDGFAFFTPFDSVHCINPPPPNFHFCDMHINQIWAPGQVCLGDSAGLLVDYQSPHTVKSIVWEPGNYHGATVYVSPRTDVTYTVTITDTLGCQLSATVTVDTMYCAPPPPCGNVIPPSICYVTTDTSGAFNSVIWQKVGMDTLAIDSIIIYRQNILNNYVRTGAVSVHAHTIYKDYSAQPLVEPSFYELGVRDTCGLDSNLSYYNETVFLQTSTGIGPNQTNLNWNFYEGNPVVYYRILRDDSGRANWHAIDSVQGSINAYTDRHAPVNPHLRYMIGIDWNVACSPFLHNASLHRYTFNPLGSYSNISYLYSTGVNNLSALNNSLTLFPNPVNSVLSITINQSFSGSVTITDVLGQEVYPKGIHSDSNTQFTSQKGNTEEIDMSGLRSGVYIISIQSGDAVVRRKIIKI